MEKELIIGYKLFKMQGFLKKKKLRVLVKYQIYFFRGIYGYQKYYWSECKE